MIAALASFKASPPILTSITPAMAFLLISNLRIVVSAISDAPAGTFISAETLRLPSKLTTASAAPPLAAAMEIPTLPDCPRKTPSPTKRVAWLVSSPLRSKLASIPRLLICRSGKAKGLFQSSGDVKASAKLFSVWEGASYLKRPLISIGSFFSGKVTSAVVLISRALPLKLDSTNSLFLNFMSDSGMLLMVRPSKAARISPFICPVSSFVNAPSSAISPFKRM